MKQTMMMMRFFANAPTV